MSRYKQRLGEKGERLALGFLRQNGYKIINRNFSCRFGEIDIIARQGKVTVFIEVKTRSSSNFGPPQDSINKYKIKHLWRSAQYYIKRHANPQEEFRFDAVSILLEEKPRINLIKGII